MAPIQILVLGATGYIGGSLLTALLKSGYAGEINISALVRKQEDVEKLATVGVKGVIFKDLDDFQTIRDAAKDHDIVIAAASARHTEAARACIDGLALRRQATGQETHYVHTSGASMVGDWPESGGRIDSAVHSDLDDIYQLEKNFPDSFSPVRKVDLFVVEFGETKAVRTYIIPPPLIFGRGTGLFTQGVGQIHQMLQIDLKKGQSVMIGSGVGVWSRVHIEDLSNLYQLLIAKLVSGKSVSYGRTGYYFAENGSQSWKSIAEAIGEEGKNMGIFKTSDVGQVELQYAADVHFDGNVRDAEGVLASNSRTKADRAREELGWNPRYGDEDFAKEIKEVVEIMVKQQGS